MDLHLAGKIAVVTGASRGIGLATVRRLRDEGATVIGAARTATPELSESGADVVLRVRAALDAVAREHAGERVLVVCHQITILCARFAIEGMTEAELDAAWRRYDLANCSLTEYRAGGGGRLALTRLAYTVPVEEGAPALARDGAPVTAEPPAGAVR